MRSATIVAALAVLLGGCQEALGPDSLGHEVITDRLRVTLSVTPDVLDAPGTVTATLTYENLGLLPITVTSSYGCLSFAGVYRGEQRIPFPATEYACRRRSRRVRSSRARRSSWSGPWRSAVTAWRFRPARTVSSRS